MKKSLVISVLCLLFAITANAGILVLEGHYQGKNLFVKNSFGGSGVGFCVFEVTVNGELSTDEINSSAFEIDFNNFKLKLGDPIIVNIKHKDDCDVQVLNPDVLKPKSTFNTSQISFDKNGVLNWTTNNETGEMDYIVEQFRWNKWVKVGEVKGKGVPGAHKYSFKVTPHSGANKARVKQVDYTGKPRYSPAAEFTSSVPEISLEGKTKFKDEIAFSNGETLYEIYDKYGNIVKRGFGSKANISTLEKGIYYLSYDNKTETITIR
jgi:hypothetical protein|tara:strand:- start:485 stop:1279 length:795 start_codon:yes stop_codon:yes gene_type:complete